MRSVSIIHLFLPPGRLNVRHTCSITSFAGIFLAFTHIPCISSDPPRLGQKKNAGIERVGKNGRSILSEYMHRISYKSDNLWSSYAHECLPGTIVTIRTYRYRVFIKNCVFSELSATHILHVVEWQLIIARDPSVQSLLLVDQQPIAAECWQGRGGELSRILEKKHNIKWTPCM